MDLFNMYAKLALDSSNFNAGIAQATEKGRGFSQNIGKTLKTAGNLAVAGLAAISAAAVSAATAIGVAAGETAAYGDSIDKSSQKLGVSSTFYQEWDAVLQHSGTSMDAASAAFKTLAKASGNTSKEQKKAFKALGISMKEVNNLSQEELFQRVVSGLQGMEEGADRTAIATALLGKGAVEMGALFNTSQEDTQAMIDRVHELGGVMSEDAVAASAHYQDSLQDLQTVFSGAKRNLVADFLPSITTVMDGLTALFTGDESGIELIKTGIDGFITTLGEKIEPVTNAGMELIGAVGSAIIDNLPDLAETGVTLIGNVGSSILNNLPTIAENLGTFAGDLAGMMITAIADPETWKTLGDAGVKVVEGLAAGISAGLMSVPLFNDIVTKIDEFFAAIGGTGGVISEAVQGITGTDGNIEKNMNLDFVVEWQDDTLKRNAEQMIAQLMLALENGSYEGDINEFIDFSDIGGVDPETEAAIKQYAQGLVDTFDGESDKLNGVGKSIGADFSQGMVDGINSNSAAVAAAAAALGAAAENATRKAIDSHSPSRVMKEIGGFFSDGFALGISGGMDRVRHAATMVADKATAAASGGFNGRLNSGSGTGNGTAQQKFGFYINGRLIAEALRDDTAIAQNTRTRRLAFGFGG